MLPEPYVPAAVYQHLPNMKGINLQDMKKFSENKAPDALKATC